MVGWILRKREVPFWGINELKKELQKDARRQYVPLACARSELRNFPVRKGFAYKLARPIWPSAVIRQT